MLSTTLSTTSKITRIACAAALSAVLGIALAGTANVSQAHAANVSVKSYAQLTNSKSFTKTAANGKTCGTAKSNAKAITRIKLELKGKGSGAVSYSAGYSGASKKTVSWVKVNLTGKVKKTYNVYYRVYVKGYGWMGWAKDGKMAGSKGCKKDITAYQVKLVKKSAKKKPNMDRAAFCNKGGFLVSITGNSSIDAKIMKVAQKNKMDLAKCYDWATMDKANIVYAGSNGPIRSNKEWTASRIKTEAKSAFIEGHGDCYTYSVAICCLAKYLGYEAKPVAGTSVSAATNTSMDTSWAQVKQNGKWMVYDGLHASVGKGKYYAGQFAETWKSYEN